MPYKISGNSVIKADTGKLVGHSNNPKAYLRTLQAVEHGWKPSRKNKIGDAYVKMKYAKR